jgi:predicted DNA-binding transcriptional regulator AlpA
MTAGLLVAPPISSTSSLTRFGGGVSDQFLTIADLADLLGKAQQTIHKYRTDSRPGRRYAATPFPEPDRTVGTMPVWNADRLGEIKAWLDARPGMGVGGGRPRKAEAESPH